MDVKQRRLALGWDRTQLADRSGVPKSVVALIERGAWSEEESIGRVVAVLELAEAGHPDPRLPPPSLPGSEN